MSIFEGKFMLFVRTYGPINTRSGQEHDEQVGFNWDIPHATSTWKDGIFETDGKRIVISAELDLGQSLFHIS